VRLDLLALLGLGSVALVVSIYSGHLSALALDIHEHLTWVRQIVTRGHVPLDEPPTGIVGDYPRTFHVLTALWNAAGLSAPAGPFAKAMPFLQNALPALALAEQMVDARAPKAAASRRGWEIVLGLAFYTYAFLLVPMVYPSRDLLGTPRFSSGGLLLLPIVLLFVARVQHAPRAACLALTTAPLLAAWALSWNPIVVVLLVVVTVPVAVAFLVALRPARSQGPGRRETLAAVAISATLGTLVLVQDPWVVTMAARHVPACRSLLARTGLVTFDEAVALGRASPREKSVRNAKAAPPCGDARCVLALAASVAWDALSAPMASARTAVVDLRRLGLSPSVRDSRDAFRDSFFVRPAIIADFAGLPFFACVASAVLLSAWRALRRSRSDGPEDSDGGRALVASLVGLAAAGSAMAFAAGLAAALNDQRHESFLLAGYLGVAGGHVSLAFFWLLFAAAICVLAQPLLTRPASPGPDHPAPCQRAAVILAGAGLLLWTALPLAARLNLHRPIQHRGFWSAVGVEDLRALRQVEAAIPPADGVIVPAEHMNLPDWEHWVLPLGHTTALLPYGERRYLFNVYLGASYPFSWRDLEEGLCSKDPEVRSRFFERSGARWALVRDLAARDAAAALHQPRMCQDRGVSLGDLGAELPAVREQGGIFLFRLGRRTTASGAAPPLR
jgi:hypothetical protein